MASTPTSESSSLDSQTSTDSTSISDSGNACKEGWIKQIYKILDREDKAVDISTRVSIFRVPKALRAFKPEAYEPQLMGLGPYHHIRSELFEMERYKLAAAIRFEKSRKLEFKELVRKLNEFEDKIRACYHMYLDFDQNGLLCIMALDGLFLLEFLHNYVNKKRNRTACLVDSAGKKLAHNGILRDIMMLENQIPIFLLHEIFSIQFSLPDTDLPSMLLNFCKLVSPIKLREDLLPSQVSNFSHLLDLLYHATVPKKPGNRPCVQLDRAGETCTVEMPPGAATCEALESNSGNTQVFPRLWTVLSSLNNRWVKKVTTPIRAIMGVPWDVVKGLPEVSNLMPNDEEKAPIVEEILIPSVSDLCDAGVKFCPSLSPGDITTIKFDKKKKRFYLPVITLNANSEVIIRNLVAYEASIPTDALVFTRYTELMNGIIDKAEDAKLLREKKIIVNHSGKKDDEVAQLFNGMTKSIRLSNVAYIDKAIEDVNKFYRSTPKVRIYNSMKKYIYGSWQILTVLAAVLLILLTAIQSFCTVYRCPRLFMNTIS